MEQEINSEEDIEIEQDVKLEQGVKMEQNVKPEQDVKMEDGLATKPVQTKQHPPKLRTTTSRISNWRWSQANPRQVKRARRARA